MKDTLEKTQKFERNLEQSKPGERSMDKSIHESEHLYHAILDSMGDSIHIIDRQFRIIFASERSNLWLEQVSLPKIILGQTLHEAFPFLSEKVYEEYRQVVETGKTVMTEEKTKIGQSEFITETQKIPVMGKGKVVNVVTIIRDLTELKKNQGILASEKNKLQSLIDSLEFGITIQDREYNIIFQNEFMKKIFGNMWEKCYQIYESRDNVCDGCPIELSFRDGMPHKTERKVIAQSGETLILDITSTPIRDDEGNVFSCFEITQDITERKSEEEALAKSYAFLKGVIESPKNVVIFALDHEYRYIAFNKNHHQTMKQIWGVDITLGNSILEYIKNTEDRQKAKLNFDRALSGESFIIIEEYGDTMLERRCYEDIYNPIIDETGHIIGLTLFLTDITERKRAEEERERLQSQLLQAQKMESVGRLAGGVAHDFNNMLSVIIGYSELGMNQLSSADPLYTSMQQIRKAAGRSADLTRQLLAFARKQTVSPLVLNLNECVESMLKMLRRLIGEDIDLAWLPGAKIWPVKVDPSQIDQVLVNLCVNARDAISGVGRITIETHPARIDESYCAGHPDAAPGEYVVLSVSDNGYGMDKETLNNLFEPFFTTKERGKGTGLGLATVYGIVKQNSGFIDVYSEPGQGTTFKIYVPRHTAWITQPQEETPGLPPTSPGNETILLVEDESAILDIERLMLESLGYHVLTASAPQEALLTAREKSGGIQLLITDVIMPEMNGRELAKNLTFSCPGIKILFMSGYSGDIIAHHGVLDDGMHFIQKPFSIQGLAAKVREVLDGK